MRIYRNKYYIVEFIPGCSGFQRWDEKEYRVVTGHKARNDRSSIVKEFKENGRGQFRLEDGHLPDYQPRAKEKEITLWLDYEMFGSAFILNPSVYGL